MAINTINLGSAPDDDTGDAPRTAGQKINDNFTDSANAASKLVGTATGEVPTSDDLNMVGDTENYTSSNLNPNIFTGNGAKNLAFGVVVASTVAVFFLPINMLDTPSSITTSGTFNIMNSLNSISYATGLNATLDSLSSSKLCVLVMSGASGLTIGETVYLRQNSALSKITVNP